MTNKRIIGDVAKRRMERETREERIYNESQALLANPDNSPTDVMREMMRKHDIHSTSTYYAIRRRVENRINAQAI